MKNTTHKAAEMFDVVKSAGTSVLVDVDGVSSLTEILVRKGHSLKKLQEREYYEQLIWGTLGITFFKLSSDYVAELCEKKEMIDYMYIRYKSGELVTSVQFFLQEHSSKPKVVSKEEKIMVTMVTIVTNGFSSQLPQDQVLMLTTAIGNKFGHHFSMELATEVLAFGTILATHCNYSFDAIADLTKEDKVIDTIYDLAIAGKLVPKVVAEGSSTIH